MILIPVILGSALSTILLMGGMRAVLGVEDISMALFASGAGLAVLGALTLCILHLWLAIAFGFGATAAIGGVGLLVSAILGGTALGDEIWWCIPWAWPLRLAWHPLLLQLNVASGLETGVVDSYLDQVQIAAGLAVASFVLLFLAFGQWFSRWEGRQIND